MGIKFPRIIPEGRPSTEAMSKLVDAVIKAEGIVETSPTLPVDSKVLLSGQKVTAPVMPSIPGVKAAIEDAVFQESAARLHPIIDSVALHGHNPTALAKVSKPAAEPTSSKPVAHR